MFPGGGRGRGKAAGGVGGRGGMASIQRAMATSMATGRALQQQQQQCTSGQPTVAPSSSSSSSSSSSEAATQALKFFASRDFINLIVCACRMHYDELRVAASAAFGGHSAGGAVCVYQTVGQDKVSWTVHLVPHDRIKALASHPDATTVADDKSKNTIVQHVATLSGVDAGSDSVVSLLVACGGSTITDSLTKQSVVVAVDSALTAQQRGAMTQNEISMVAMTWNDGIAVALRNAMAARTTA